MTEKHYCHWGEQCELLRNFHNTLRQGRIRVYDNGGYTVDRYTVLVFRQAKGLKIADVYGMSANALSPQGFNQFSHTVGPFHALNYVEAWGKRTRWQSLPHDVLKAIGDRL